MLKSIKHERERVPKLLKIKHSEFYSSFANELDSLVEQLSIQSVSYCSSLDYIKEQNEKRRDDIFTSLSFDEPESVNDALNEVRNLFEKLRYKSNQYTESLSGKQLKARVAIRLHEVYIC